jgi:hypothetical protein
MILIDYRKGSEEFFIPSSPDSDEGHLLSTDIPAMRFKLKSGDFAFNGKGPNDKEYTIGIELKSLYDLVSSRTCGRLQGTQIRLMNATYDIRYLAYYGAYRVSKDGYITLPFYSQATKRNEWRIYSIGKQKVRHEYFGGIIGGLEEKGIRVKYFAGGLQGFDKVATMTQIAYWIEERYKWWNRDYESHTSMSGLDQSRRISSESLEATGLAKKELICANIANEIPRIGTPKAIALARHFRGSSRNMLNASVEEIADIEIVTRRGKGRVVRIGAVTAKQLKEWTR